MDGYRLYVVSVTYDDSDIKAEYFIGADTEDNARDMVRELLTGSNHWISSDALTARVNRKGILHEGIW